jgi:hypothetical protein
MHLVPDDANLDDTLLQHCRLLDTQISSFAVVSTKNISLIWHLTVGAADINIQSLADICKLASLQPTVDICNYL